MFKFFDDVRREVDDVVKPMAKRRLSAGKNGKTPSKEDLAGQKKAPATAPNNATPEHAKHIPKEELMHLSMKLSKRLKALQLTNAKLVEDRKAANTRVNSLESLLSEIIVTPTISDLSIEKVRQKVEEHFKSAQRHTMVQQIKEVPEDATEGPTETEEAGLLQSDSEGVKMVSLLEEQLEIARAENVKLVDVSRALREEVNKLRNDNQSWSKSDSSTGDGLTNIDDANDPRARLSKAEEKIVLLQLRLDKLKGKEEEDGRIHARLLNDHSKLRHDFDDLSSKLKETSTLLEDSLQANSLLENKIESQSLHLRDSQLLCAEKNGLIAELREKLSQRNVKAREEKLDNANKELELLRQAAEDRDGENASLSSRLQKCQNRNKAMTREIDELKTELLQAKTNDIQQQGQIQRLTNSLEIATANRKDISENAQNMKQEHDEALSKYKVLLEAEKGLQKQIAELQDNIQSTRLELDKVEDKYKNEVGLREANIAKHAKDLNDLKEKYCKENEEALKCQREEFELEIERVKATTSRKSSHAIRLVQQKDAELVKLRKRNEQLEEEVNSGRPEERKILEYAQDQAKRESYTRAIQEECETLKSKLGEKTEEVGRLHLKLQKMTRLIGGINGSTAISKVGNKNAMDNSQGGFGVNLVYLKNVVLQYMSFEEGSSERIRLIPVISTILKDIESASNGEAASKTSQK